jgi:hypothetical protein
MSKEALAKVVQRAISDGAFRRQLSSDPATALRGFDLTADESAAIKSGDAGRLTAMGVELRMSKAFTLSSDQATGNSGNSVLSNDLGASYTGAVTSGTNLGVQSSVNSALLSGSDMGAQSMGNSSLISGESVDNNAALISGGNDAAGREGAVIGGGPEHALGAQIGGDSANFNADVTDANAEGFLTSVNTGGDNATDSVLVVDDNAVSGATTPGEANDGPTLSQ